MDEIKVLLEHNDDLADIIARQYAPGRRVTKASWDAYLKSTRNLLRLLLRREPTDEEVKQVAEN